ncbi:MAG: hypothetical protein Q7V58_09455 [Actinomycetota bacterium]|nr:hypothetical protein [Actinomycetota bacterium]
MALEKFHYTTPAGVKVILPKFASLPFGVMRKVRKEGEAESMFAIIEELADPKALEQLDKMNMIEIRDLFAAWMEDSKVTLGESKAS